MSTCLSCDRAGRMCRGLCSTCYSRASRAGTLDDYVPAHQSTQIVMEEHAFLSAWGMSDAAIAIRLGMPLNTLQSVLSRQRRKMASDG